MLRIISYTLVVEYILYYVAGLLYNFVPADEMFMSIVNDSLCLRKEYIIEFHHNNITASHIAMQKYVPYSYRSKTKVIPMKKARSKYHLYVTSMKEENTTLLNKVIYLKVIAPITYFVTGKHPVPFVKITITI